MILSIQGHLDKAIEEIGSAIYIDSLNNQRWGPEDPALVSSYLMMGMLFKKKTEEKREGKREDNRELFDNLAKIVRYFDLVGLYYLDNQDLVQSG